MMRHVRDFGALSMTKRKEKKNGDKMGTLKGVRGRKDVKRVRNEGREDQEGEGERRRNN